MTANFLTKTAFAAAAAALLHVASPAAAQNTVQQPADPMTPTHKFGGQGLSAGVSLNFINHMTDDSTLINRWQPAVTFSNATILPDAIGANAEISTGFVHDTSPFQASLSCGVNAEKPMAYSKMDPIYFPHVGLSMSRRMSDHTAFGTNFTAGILTGNRYISGTACREQVWGEYMLNKNFSIRGGIQATQTEYDVLNKNSTGLNDLKTLTRKNAFNPFLAINFTL